MEFLNEYHLSGLFIGICTFLIIGLFHPVVVKAEYYWGTKCWWIFLCAGHRRRCSFTLCGEYTDCFTFRRFCFLFVLDDQRSFRTRGPRKERMVPEEPQTHV